MAEQHIDKGQAPVLLLWGRCKKGHRGSMKSGTKLPVTWAVHFGLHSSQNIYNNEDQLPQELPLKDHLGVLQLWFQFSMGKDTLTDETQTLAAVIFMA